MNLQLDAQIIIIIFLRQQQKLRKKFSLIFKKRILLHLTMHNFKVSWISLFASNLVRATELDYTGFI